MAKILQIVATLVCILGTILIARVATASTATIATGVILLSAGFILFVGTRLAAIPSMTKQRLQQQVPTKVISIDEPFCMKCGEDGLTTTEMGMVISKCPKCGITLG